MPLISHRGAKGLGPENTLDSITAAAKLGADYIEFDVQRTKDDHPIVFHNLHTRSGNLVCELTLAEIQAQHPQAPLLSAALAACGESIPLVELKSSGAAQVSEDLITSHPTACTTTFMASELVIIQTTLQSRQHFLMQRKHPIGLLKKAKSIKATGIGINKNWALLLPYYYWHARRQNLQVYTYTLNSRLLAWVLLLCMPHLLICTDYPNKLSAVYKGRQ